MSQIKQYLLSNWFKVSLVVVIVLAFMQKDFSLSFNLKQPIETVEPQNLNPGVKLEQEKSTKITGLEKKAQIPAQKSSTSLFENFSLPFFGKSAAKNTVAWKEVAVAARQAYINRFVHVARNEQEKFGVPASVIIGNALLQSNAGKRPIASEANNHFAIPCTADWAGGQKLTETGCYRAYESAWFSFRDHSTFLNNGDFGQLRQFGTDYRAWAKGLAKLGYPYQGDLARDLVEVIEAHNLHRYDF